VLGGNPFWWLRIVSSSFNYLELNNHNGIWFLKLESGLKPNLVLNWRTWIWGENGLELRVNCQFHIRLPGPDFQNWNQNLNLFFQNWTRTRPKILIFFSRTKFILILLKRTGTKARIRQHWYQPAMSMIPSKQILRGPVGWPQALFLCLICYFSYQNIILSSNQHLFILVKFLLLATDSHKKHVCKKKVPKSEIVIFRQ
jgi:hypothetical protein